MTSRALLGGALLLAACPAKTPKPEGPAPECLPLLTCGCFSGCREVHCHDGACRPPAIEGKMGSPHVYRLTESDAGTPILVPRTRNCYATCEPAEPPPCTRTAGMCGPATPP